MHLILSWEAHQSHIINSLIEDLETTKLNLSIFIRIGSCCPIQYQILKKQNIFRGKFTHFPIIKNTINQIANQKFVGIVYNFMPTFLSYAPTFFPPMLGAHGHWACCESSFTCHTYCDTGPPFIMVISEDSWHSHLLPRVCQKRIEPRSPTCEAIALPAGHRGHLQFR